MKSTTKPRQSENEAWAGTRLWSYNPAQWSSLTDGYNLFGKALGGFSGVVDVGIGVADLSTAGSGWDRTAGGLRAISGGFALGSIAVGPLGWLELGFGVLSSAVADGDARVTADLDPRLVSQLKLPQPRHEVFILSTAPIWLLAELHLARQLKRVFPSRARVVKAESQPAGREHRHPSLDVGAFMSYYDINEL